MAYHSFCNSIGRITLSICIAAFVLSFTAPALQAGKKYCPNPSITFEPANPEEGEVEAFCKEAARTHNEDYIVLGNKCTLCPKGTVVEVGAGESPDAGGKYCGLLYHYHCPVDSTYAPFTDYGHWGGGVDSNCKESGLPAGYYVYFEDYWYVYGNVCGTAGGGSSGGGSAGGGSSSSDSTSAYGKYCDSLGSYYCPNDGKYPPYTDHGHWGGGRDTSCKQSGLPAGYYVYDKDTWYIYAREC